MAGNPIRISILANARDAIRNLNRAAKAVRRFDQQARKSATGLRTFGRELNVLNGSLKSVTGSLRVGGQAMGKGLMGFIALGVAAGAAQVGSALTAGLLAALPAVGVLPGFALAAASALTVLKVATSGVADAMTLGLKAAASGSAKDIKAYNAAMSKLAPSAASAVSALVKLNPALIKVRNAVADKFFAGFTAEIKALAGTYLPLLSAHGQKVAASLNHAGREVSGLFREGGTVKKVSKIFGNLEKTIDDAASAVRPLIRGLLPLFSVSSSMLPGLTSGFRESSIRFADFMAQAEKSGKLKASIQGGLDALKSMFDLLKDVGSILKSVFVDANKGAGSLFGTIGTVIKQVAAFLDTAEGMKAVGVVWDGLRDVGTALGKALKVVLPALGKALVAISPVVKPLANAMSGFLITLAPLLPVAGKLAAVFGTQLAGVFTTLGPVLLRIGESAGGLLTKLAPLVGSIAEVAAIIGTGLADAVDKLMPSLGPFVTALGGALVTAAKAIAPLLPEIGVAFGEILETVTPLLPQIAGLVTSIASGLLPHVGPLVSVFLGLVVALKAYRIIVAGAAVVTDLHTNAVKLHTWATKENGIVSKISAAATRAWAIITNLGQLAAYGFRTAVLAVRNSVIVQTVAQKLSTAATKAGALATAAWSAVQRAAAAVAAIFRAGLIATAVAQGRVLASLVASKVATLAGTAAQLAAAAAAAVVRGAVIAWTAVQWLLNAALTANPIGLVVVGIAALIAIVVLIATKTTWFQTIWKVCWTAIKTAAMFVFNFLKAYFVRTFAFYRSIFTGLVDGVKTIWAGLSALPTKIGEWLGKVLTFFRELPGKILGFLTGLKDKLLNAGKDIIQGLIDGVKNKFQDVKDLLGKLTELLPDWKGPESKDRKLLFGAGQTIIGGLNKGLRNRIPVVKKTLAAVSSTIASGIGSMSGVVSGVVATDTTVKLRADAGMAGAGSAAVLPPIVVNNYNATGVDPAEVGRKTIAAIEAWQKRNGRVRLLPAA